MNPVPSTAEVLAFKILNRLTDKAWIDWAYEMLVSGVETENILILAGMQEPLDYFEMKTLTDKVLSELRLDYSNKKEIRVRYASYMIKKALEGGIEQSKVLRELRDLYIELDYDFSLLDFYNLYYAWEDLQFDEVQWYVDGADRSNINQVIVDRFTKWVKENPVA